jgi:hypothetical protein
VKDELLWIGMGNGEQIAWSYRRVQILIHSIESIRGYLSDRSTSNPIRPKIIFGLTWLCMTTNKESDQTAGHRESSGRGLTTSEKVLWGDGSESARHLQLLSEWLRS